MSLDDRTALTPADAAKLKQALADASADLEAAYMQIDTYEQAIGDDEAYIAEIKQLREFIGDLRLGIRSLDEYEDVCGGTWVL